MYHSDRYGDDPQLRASLRFLSRSLYRVRGDIKKCLLEEDVQPEPLKQSIANSLRNEELR